MLKKLNLKFILLLMGLGILSSMGMCIINYFQYHDYIISSIQKTLRDTGELVESQLPVLGDVEYLRREGIAKSETFTEILKKLQKYNDAFGFYYIYLIENSPKGFVFLLDTDILNGGDTFLKTYSAMDDLFKLVIDTQQIQVSGIYKDEYGTFISAFVPVIRHNKVVSILGIDYEISHLSSLEQRAVVQVLISLAINLILVIILAVLISNSFVNLMQKTNDLNKKLTAANEKLESLVRTDELTKLNNRRSYFEYMDFIWKQNLRLNLPVSLIMIDIDYFKKYNDLLGHVEGDKVLSAVAQCIKNQIKRETDFIARYGGEEFVCLLPFTEKDKALDFAKALVKSVEDMKIVNPASENSKYLTISAGLATAVPGNGNSHMQLLEAADKALYKAKESGRNRVAAE